MKYNLKLCCLFFILIIVQNAYAGSLGLVQRLNNEPKSFWQRVYPGGNIGLSFGRIFFVEVSPLAGYWITERLTAGLSLNYFYFRGPVLGTQLSEHVVGVSPFGRYFVTNWLFAHAELGLFNGVRIANEVPLQTVRANAVFPLVGAGTTFGFGKRSGILFMALYNLNFDPNFLLFNNSPITLRVGFFF